jgi:hypothetical protein
MYLVLDTGRDSLALDAVGSASFQGTSVGLGTDSATFH